MGTGSADIEAGACPKCNCKDVRLVRWVERWNVLYMEVRCRFCGKVFRVGTKKKACLRCGSGRTQVTRTDEETRYMKCLDCGENFKLVAEAEE